MVDYKLRLGDGTTFSVDEKGLTTWVQGGLVDDKARVQPSHLKSNFRKVKIAEIFDEIFFHHSVLGFRCFYTFPSILEDSCGMLKAE